MNRCWWKSLAVLCVLQLLGSVGNAAQEIPADTAGDEARGATIESVPRVLPLPADQALEEPENASHESASPESASPESTSHESASCDDAPAPAAVPQDVRDHLRRALYSLSIGEVGKAEAEFTGARIMLPPEHWLMPILGTEWWGTESELKHLALTPPKLVKASKEDESVAAMYTALTIYGLYTGAWLFGVLAELDGSISIPLSVATAGGGLGLAYALDHQDEPIGGAAADAISSGVLLGAASGGLLLGAIDFDGGAKGGTSIIWGTALAGGVLGGAVTRAFDATRGSVALSTSAYIWGGLFGLCAASLIDVNGGNDVSKIVLGGAIAGIGTGSALASVAPTSPSRVLYINLGGIAGALVGVAGLAAASSGNEKAIAGVLGLTSAAGLLAAAHLTSDLDTAADENTLAWSAAPTLLGSKSPMRGPVPGVAVQLGW